MTAANVTHTKKENSIRELMTPVASRPGEKIYVLDELWCAVQIVLDGFCKSFCQVSHCWLLFILEVLRKRPIVCS